MAWKRVFVLLLSLLAQGFDGRVSIAREGTGGDPSADSNRGRLVVSENGRFLVTEDGQPFFWLGDTAWSIIESIGARRG